MSGVTELSLDPDRGTVRIFAHVISAGSPLPCFTYVTHGLTELGQREIALTVPRSADERPETVHLGPRMFCRTVSRLAQEGRLVDSGSVTGFGPGGALDRAELRGFVYCAAEPMDGVEIPRGCLSAISLVGDELAAIRQGGPLRLLARLGQAARFFPAPPWIDASRPPRASLGEGSLLERFPTLHCPRVGVVVDGDQITIRAAHEARRRLEAAITSLPARTAFGLLTDLDPTADGCLVWLPGQRRLSGITPPGSAGKRLSGCCILFNPEQSGDGAGHCEDGFAALLSNEGYDAIREALANGTEITLEPRPGEKALTLTWVDHPSASPRSLP